VKPALLSAQPGRLHKQEGGFFGNTGGEQRLSVPLMENRIRRAKPRKSEEDSQQQRLLPLPHNLLVPEGPVDLGREEFVMIQLLHEWVL